MGFLILNKRDYDNQLKQLNKKFLFRLARLGKFLNGSHKTKHKCLKCSHIWFPRPNNINAGRGCPNCQRLSAINRGFKRFKLALRTHRLKLSGSYKGTDTGVKCWCLFCKNHCLVIPNRFLNQGSGCKNCGILSRAILKSFTPEIFEQKLSNVRKELVIKKHEGMFLTVYSTKCNHTWRAHYQNLRRGSGCPMCVSPSRRYSKIAIEWVEQYAFSHRLKGVQHAKQGGEFVIPGTQWRVDGYHKASNTVFEFLGDCWHGNQNLFNPKCKPHPFCNKTAQKLYKETMMRLKAIKSSGFKVIYIWESDYKSGNKHTILKMYS